ncbi:MAG: hypothetical protein AB1704_20680 [Pseudomonadota bacterium]
MQSKQPQQLSFEAFCQRATIQMVTNRGRTAAVYFDGDLLRYVDAIGQRGLRQAHKGQVSNVLYLHSGLAPSDMARPALPTPDALADYPDLISKFPIAASLLGFFVERNHLGVLSARYCFPSDEEQKTLQHVMEAYGFLVERNERVSLLELVDRISSHCDVTDPRNRVAVEALRSGAGVSKYITH